MAEPEDMGRTIQRVIDDKYPCTRVLWQSFQPQPAPRPNLAWTGSILNRANTATTADLNRSTTTNTRPREEKKEALDKVVQRVINLMYPETRLTWMNSREDSGYLRAAGRGLTSGSRPGDALPNLNRSRKVHH
jgi:hypothetical protein